MIVGGVVMIVAPMLGILASSVGLSYSFDAVEGSAVPASEKAGQLAGGMEVAMHATAIGIGVGVAGAVLLMVCLILLLVSRRAVR